MKQIGGKPSWRCLLLRDAVNLEVTRQKGCQQHADGGMQYVRGNGNCVETDRPPGGVEYVWRVVIQDIARAD